MKLTYSCLQLPLYLGSVLLLAAACTGCNKQTSSIAVVRGKVLLDGQPLANGGINTIPAAGRGSSGVIRNGEFELGTMSKNDGAMIGTHRVAIVAREASQGGGPEAAAGKSLIPERYSNPDASGLTIEVKAGEVNTPTLDLTSR